MQELVTGEDWEKWLRLAAQPSGGSVTSPGLWETLTWVARRAGFTVSRGGGPPPDSGVTADGTDWVSQTDGASRRIIISPALSEGDAVRALLHELGHVAAHADVLGMAGLSTRGCRGLRWVEAESVAFIVAARLGLDTAGYEWPFVASWAGSDPRARPGEAVRAAGNRIMRAADVLTSQLAAAAGGGGGGDAAAVGDEEDIRRVLAAAQEFYQRRLPGSWAQRYLAGRGAGERWRGGYAPGGWTALTGHLRRAGFGDPVIEVAGVARRSARGTLIDCLRDRAVLAVRDEQGRVAGFLGRARPGAGDGAPKYLNSPQTPVYRKGELLFGLAEARDLLAGGAVPVIVEGPFDAIAVTVAGDGRYAGLAPCGTALTGRQVAVLASAADLQRVGVVVALDGDAAGRRGAARAYAVLAAFTDRLSAAIMPDRRDPADVLQRDGAGVLVRALRQVEPLARVAIDAHLDQWGERLRYPEGQLAAMRSAAQAIVSTLSGATVDALRQVAGGESAAVAGEAQGQPDLVQVAEHLPAWVTCQIVRVAQRTGSECSDVTAEVAKAVVAGGDRAAGRDGSSGGLISFRLTRAPHVPQLPHRLRPHPPIHPARQRRLPCRVPLLCDPPSSMIHNDLC